MHWTGKTSNLTIPCLSIKVMHHMLIFGCNHTSLVNTLCPSVIVISGWSTVNTYHVTKSMGTGSDQLRNSYGRNNTMGCLKGTSPFTSKILKSILFTVCHTSFMKIYLRIWCSIKWYSLVWWFSFFSSHCCSVDSVEGKKDVCKETPTQGTPKDVKIRGSGWSPTLIWKEKNLATMVLWQEMVLGHLVQRKSLM